MQVACRKGKREMTSLCPVSYNRGVPVLSCFPSRIHASVSPGREQVATILLFFCLSGLLWVLISCPSFALSAEWPGFSPSVESPSGSQPIPARPIHPFWPPVTPPSQPDGSRLLDWSLKCWLERRSFWKVKSILTSLFQTFRHGLLESLFLWKIMQQVWKVD